ncbi:hypothetical protein ILUMI_21362 [Ignelater luminosus]|uniref:Uncharacterized protein n=1 Tax=Ignelater luminosus TaxID=2038154 RepID=A0A8K0CCL8_IGNLU|nr:hypothetical protein ILUMI_21362 [Ignelater luminosus]
MSTLFKLLLFAVCLLWNQASLAVHLPSLGSGNRHDEVCNSYDYNDAATGRLVLKYLICKNMNIQPAKHSILVDIPPNDIQYIAFENSSLPTITNMMFSKFSNLSVLNLKKSKISTVSSQAFHGMTQLENLYLQDNKIQEFPKDAFDFLTNLKVLDLSNNVLQILQRELLSNLTNLKVLKLEGNSLYFLERNCFLTLKSLEVLDITNNKILLDPFHTVFHIHSRNLTRVLASGNLFFKFPIAGKTQLTFMDVSNNRWTQINLHQFYHLKFANVSHNKIATICTLGITTIEDLCLEEFDLSYNLLRRIDKHVFQNLTHLQRLHLNNNFIKELVPGCFANLKNMTFLSLSFNELEYLEFDYFTGLEKLITLNLNHNNLYKQPESEQFLFSSLRNLRYLYIDSNLYNAIDAERFVKGLPNLKMITLKNNRWNCKQIFEAVEIFRNSSIAIAEKRAEESYILSNACPEYFSDCVYNVRLHLLFLKVSILLLLMIMTSLVILMVRRYYYVLRLVKKQKSKAIRKQKAVIIRMLKPTSAIKIVR